MDKDEKEKLEEIIRLLRKLLSRNDYRPRLEYRASRHNLPIARGGSGYRAGNYFPQHYQAYQGSGLRNEAKKYETREKTNSYSTKPWNEPMQYQPRERIVYDPEVKRILKSIEQKLGSDPKAEEILRQLENNPELYEKVIEKLSNDLESSEANEPDLDRGAEEEAKYEAGEQGPEAEEPIDQETSEEAEPSVEAETKVEEELLRSSGVEISSEPSQEVIEPQAEKPGSEVIEKIEAQDLSSLEAELYQEPLEPIELIEPELEPLEPLIQRNEPLEPKAEGEAEDY